MRITAIICAAGQGRRMGLGMNKQFLELEGKPLLIHTLERWKSFTQLDELVVVVGENDVVHVRQLVEAYALQERTRIVAGGKERQHSVYQGLCALRSSKPDVVLIHDGARPFVLQQQVDMLIQSVKEHRAAVLAIPVKDTIKKVDAQQNIVATLNRNELWAIQTPQAFDYELVLQAHERAGLEEILATDDAALVERQGYTVKVVQGHEHNIKLTTPEDIELAHLILQQQKR